jgi:hypothetical protein
MASKIPNFLVRTFITFIVGIALSWLVFVVFWGVFISLPNVFWWIGTALIFIVASWIVFSRPSKWPIFESDTPTWIRISTMILAVLLIGGSYEVLLLFLYRADIQNSIEGNAKMEKTILTDQYLHDHAEELKRLYGEGCFVLTANYDTYALDAKYASMSEKEQFNALVKINSTIDKKKNIRAYCTNELQYY